MGRHFRLIIINPLSEVQTSPCFYLPGKALRFPSDYPCYVIILGGKGFIGIVWYLMFLLMLWIKHCWSTHGRLLTPGKKNYYQFVNLRKGLQRLLRIEETAPKTSQKLKNKQSFLGLLV